MNLTMAAVLVVTYVPYNISFFLLKTDLIVKLIIDLEVKYFG